MSNIWESAKGKIDQNEFGLALWCLKIGIALQCIGYASHLLRQSSTLNTEALSSSGASSLLATIVPVAFGLLFLVLAVLTIWRPTPRVLWSISVLVILQSAIKFSYMGSLFGLTPFAHAARYLAPIALYVLLDAQQDKALRTKRALQIMTIGIAFTFFAHGTKALFHNGNFIHLINTTNMNFFGQTMSEPILYPILDIIGLVDIVAAVLILTTRWRLVPIYMAAWTFLAAWSRVTANGITAWDEVVLRGTYYFIPLAILLLWRWQDKQVPVTSPNTSPEPVADLV